MSDAQSFVGNLAELFTWIGLLIGGLCFLILLITRAVRGPLVETEAVLAAEPDGVYLRWLADDGLLRARRLAEHERAEVSDPEELRVFYRRHSPSDVSLDPVDHAERVLRMLGLVFLGVGVLAIVASVVALLV